jgi:hypothetical protein
MRTNVFSEIGGVLSIAPTHTILSSQCNVSDLKPRERPRKRLKAEIGPKHAREEEG